MGVEEFRRELLAAVDELANPQDAGEEVRQSALAKYFPSLPPVRLSCYSAGMSFRAGCLTLLTFTSTT